MRIHAKLNLDVKKLKTDLGLDKNGRVQRYVDQFVLYESEPYLPGNHLIPAGVNSTEFGSGKVIWDSPDAQYLYEGKLMVDPITLKGAFFDPEYGYWSRPKEQAHKIMDPQGRNLYYHSGGKRGSHWFDEMIKEKMDDLINGIEREIFK